VLDFVQFVPPTPKDPKDRNDVLSQRGPHPNVDRHPEISSLAFHSTIDDVGSPGEVNGGSARRIIDEMDSDGTILITSNFSSSRAIFAVLVVDSVLSLCSWCRLLILKP
jgi:hypothetical protein